MSVVSYGKASVPLRTTVHFAEACCPEAVIAVHTARSSLCNAPDVTFVVSVVGSAGVGHPVRI